MHQGVIALATDVFTRLKERVEQSGLPFTLHCHAASRTVRDAEAKLDFEVRRIVKTVAFLTRDGRVVLAAVRADMRVDYPRLAALLGINRRDLSPLSPEEVKDRLGVEPGSVSPLVLQEDVVVLVDEEVLQIMPTVYCGIGRPDRTLEMAPAYLVSLSGARTGSFSRP